MFWQVNPLFEWTEEGACGGAEGDPVRALGNLDVGVQWGHSSTIAALAYFIGHRLRSP